MMSRADPLIMYVIYCRPADYPDSYVVRRWGIGPGYERAEAVPLAVVPTLRRAREQIPLGLTHFRRQPGDDPVIVEVWF
jgi:hypothetical protein